MHNAYHILKLEVILCCFTKNNGHAMIDFINDMTGFVSAILKFLQSRLLMCIIINDADIVGICA